MRSNKTTNTILKILYVIIALTSFMLIRQYSFNMDAANNTVTNTNTNSSYSESYSNTNSSFYDLE